MTTRSGSAVGWLGALARRLTGGAPEADSLITLGRSLASDSLVYLAGVALIGLGNFILVPLYTRLLPPAEFGVVALVEVLIAAVVAIAQLGLGVAYIKWYAETAAATQRALLFTLLLLTLFTSLAGGAALWAFVASAPGARWLQFPARSFAWTLLPIVALETLHALLLAHLQARRAPLAFSLGSVMRLVGTVGAALWFVGVRGQGVTGVFHGRLVGDLVGLVTVLGLSLDQIRPALARRQIRDMVAYGLPLVWTTLTGGILFELSERYFVNHYLSVAEVGHYGAGAKVSSILAMLVIQPFATAWGGLIFHIAKKPDAPRIYSRVLGAAYLVVMGVGAAMIFSAPLLFGLLTTPAYAAGMSVFPIFLLAHGFRILEYLTALSFYLTQRTRGIAYVYTVCFAISVGANLLLVPRLGMVGAALTRVLALALATWLLARIGARHYRVPVDRWSLALALALWTAAAAVMRGQVAVDLSWGMAGRAAGLSALALLLVAAGLMRILRNSRRAPDTAGAATG